MAAPRRNASKPDDPRQRKTREAIRTTQLVKRLQCFALGVPDDAGNIVDLDAQQLKATEMLLRKSLPDLMAIDGDTGKAGVTLNIQGHTFDL